MKKLIFLFGFFLLGCAPTEVHEVATEAPALVYPIENFESGITLKSFGTSITPATSPVQPERFSGYHAGVDVEAGDLEGDVPVYSIADGEVVVVRSVDGYGGVVVIECTFDGEPMLALYGHVDLGSVSVAEGDFVSMGQQVAVLGEGYTDETDGERKHLHFALIPGSTVTYLGYVQNEAALSTWVNPVAFFEERL